MGLLGTEYANWKASTSGGVSGTGGSASGSNGGSSGGKP